MFQTQFFPNAAEASQALAQAVADDLRAVLLVQERATLAVSGGRSPIAFFQQLSQMDLDWRRVLLTLVDERLVPHQHPDSNTALVQKYLLCHRAKVAKWIPVLPPDDEQHDDVVDFALRHWHAPDVVVLGMGTDGHTASLFPEAPQLNDALNENAPPLMRISPITAPHERISMTLPALENVPHLYLAIGGEEKNRVFQQAAQGLDKRYPISCVLHSSKCKVCVFNHE